MLTRRALLISMPALLTGCVTAARQPVSVKPTIPAEYLTMYAAVEGEPFPIAAANLTRVDPQFYRREVDYPTYETPGTIVVDTQARYLYLVGENGRALRYGIGVGKAGLEFEGGAVVQYKRQWPRWTPPNEMVARQPELEPYSIANGGMDPGLMNPLGARALYIFQDGKDTLYRIHGSPEWWSIGKSVSSGCVRMFNHDVVDLYNRVDSGTPILVTGNLAPIYDATISTV